MEWIGSKSKTRLYNDNTRLSLPIYGKLPRTRALKSHDNSENYHYKQRNRYYKYLYTIATIGSLIAPSASLAADVGGVSATANPIANSSGSVTNQAIQVLQGPYITNTYGGGIQCQGPTMNLTPYITGTGNFKRPMELYYNDPVYDVHDADDDGQIDNPGNVLYYMPTRTNQQDAYNLSVGMSATWSKPLDKTLQEQCKLAATTQIALQQQLTANKRLDFEIARLKNCGELMKAGIVFTSDSPYRSVCADVTLIQPVGVISQHTHQLPEPKVEEKDDTTSSSDASSEEEDLSSSDTHQPESQNEKDGKWSFPTLRWPWSNPALLQDETPEESDQQAALLGGPMHLPPSQSPPSSKLLEHSVGIVPQD